MGQTETLSNETSVQGRLHYFDMAKGFGIILVVLGHIEYISDPLRAWISSFHMPLFFVVSGMLICYKSEVNLPLRDSFKKKAKGLLIPYFWFSVIYFFIDILNLFLNKIDLTTFIKNALSSVTFYGVSVLWFLPALLLAECGFLALQKYLPRFLPIAISLIIAIAAYLLQLNISSIYSANESSLLITTLIDFLRVFLRAAIALFFVCAGYYFFPIINRVRSFSFIQLIIGIVLFIVNLFLSQINGCVDFHYIIEENVPMFYICALMGSVSLILICKNMKNLPPIAFFGKNSLIVMATHVNTYVLYAAILIAWQIDTIVTRAKSYIFNFNIMIFTFLFEAIIILVINRFFPFILGKGSLFKRKGN